MLVLCGENGRECDKGERNEPYELSEPRGFHAVMLSDAEGLPPALHDENLRSFQRFVSGRVLGESGELCGLERLACRVALVSEVEP